jgi:hypothetical protein
MKRSGPLQHARRGGFALLEVIAFAAILGLAVLMLQRTLLAAEVSLMQARLEAAVGRNLRFHANLLVNCPYDLLPAEGEQVLESGHAFRPYEALSGSYEDKLPFRVLVVRATSEAGTESERADLQLRVEYTAPADVSSGSTVLPTRTREHPLILRRPPASH